MITYESALKRILDHMRVAEAEEKPPLKSIGQVLADDIQAGWGHPPRDISVPDGYAVRAADIAGATGEAPVTLRIIETVRAGRVPKRAVRRGTATRIMTGSLIPKGADCVVRFEDTDEPPDKNGPNPETPSEVKIGVAATPGANIRRPGSNAQEGSLLVSKGTSIGPAQISVLISTGKESVRVIRRPVIGVIATGDELVAPGRRLGAGQSYNSNTAVICALIEHYGGIPRVLGVARDNGASLLTRIRNGMDADALITSGGVSKGDYDLVRLVLGAMGELLFSRIKMAPGASVAFGLARRPSGSIPVFALAGPPGGCMINFETLVRPAILRMRGLTSVDHPSVEARAIDSVHQKMSMAFVRWTRLVQSEGEYRVALNVAEALGSFASMAAANSLTVIPEGRAVHAGDRIRVLPLDWNASGNGTG